MRSAVDGRLDIRDGASTVCVTALSMVGGAAYLAGMPQRPTVCVYVDGQNLFRRALKGTPYLWLDLARLCREVLPRFELHAVKYFTARVRPSPHDLFCGERQGRYLAALATSPLIDIHLGHFRRDVLPMPVHPWELDDTGQPRMVRVKRTIEKGSDVTLATHLVWDALHGTADAYVVLSNDSDLVAPVRMLTERKEIEVGVLSPGAPVAADLQAVASWVRTLRAANFARALFAHEIHSPEGIIAKPVEW